MFEDDTFEQMSEHARNTKFTFTQKIFILLQFSETHQNLIAQVGLAWETETIFHSNSKTISQVLRLKQNSINTNFRDSGFIKLFVEPNRSGNGWKRKSLEGFSKQSTIGSVRKIKENQSIVNSDVKLFLKNDNQISKLFVFQIVQQIEIYQSEAVDAATKWWMNQIGKKSLPN
jgi:hypothetical protein